MGISIRIGQLAKMANCPVVTIRFYEKEGLLGNPVRDHSNYRIYNEADLERLRFILHCRKHDISIPDIRKLLFLRDHPQSECSFVHELINTQLGHVEEQLTSLTRLKKELQTLQSANTCQHHGNCEILARLQLADDCHFCHSVAQPIKK